MNDILQPSSARSDNSSKVVVLESSMDVHDGTHCITPEALHEAHEADLAVQAEESVDFKRAWADPVSGKVFCLSEAPSADAVKRIHERAGHPTEQVFEVPVTA